MTMVLRSPMLFGALWFMLATLATRGEAAPVLSSASGGKVRAVVIGINAYATEPTLKGAEADAADLAEALRQGGATILSDKDASFIKGPSRSAVVAVMTRLIEDSRPGDLAVITYSGHGARVPEYDFPGWKGLEAGGMNEEFVLGDYAPVGPKAGEVIVNKEMKAWLHRLDSKGVDVLFIADTCFGGGAVRGLDPRSDDLVLRGDPKSLPRPAAGQFSPIRITPEELHAEITDMPHVTFLAGADQLHQVPEVQIPGQPGTRGALSYAIAQALRGKIVDQGAVTRDALFDASLQIVSQYTNDRQAVDPEPRSNAPAIRGRTVFRLSEVAPAAPALVDTRLRLAFLNGSGERVLAHREGAPDFVVTAPNDADLVWDLADGDVTSHGDVLRRAAVAEELPDILQRMSAVAAVEKLSESRLLKVQLDQGGRLYRTGDRPGLQVLDAGDRDLVVFNIASNGLVQMLSPGRNEQAFVAEPRWSYAPRVTAPFGADQVVAVQGRQGSLDAFAAWLWKNDNRAVVAQVPGRLKDILTASASTRLGTVDLVTAP